MTFEGWQGRAKPDIEGYVLSSNTNSGREYMSSVYCIDWVGFNVPLNIL